MITKSAVTTATLALLMAIGSSPLFAQSHFDLSTTTPAVVADIASPEAKFTERAKAVTLFNASQPLLVSNGCGANDYGEGYHVKLLARLAYKDLFGSDTVLPGGTVDLRMEAFNSLLALKRSDFGSMGTDTSSCFSTDKTGDQILDIFQDIFSDARRTGDYDVLMNAFTMVLYKYGKRGENILPVNVYSHVLSLIDLSPGPGSVETLSYGANPLTTCPLICVATANPLVCLGCLAVVAAERVSLPETENHRNNIYVAQYLANQLLLDETGNPTFDNARNGYRALMLNRMREFVRNDFVEYNSHNYQDYTMTALLNLYSHADDPAVKAAVKQVLDYISAKVAVSSNDARRSTPFRRHNDPGGSPAHLCDELVRQECVNPQTAFYMMLAGVTDILGTDLGPVDVHGNPDVLPVNHAPETYTYEFQWAAANDYRIDKSILDLFVDRSHRNFYQFFHYSNTGSNDELYFASPSYLISAGGHPTENAYTADVPFPISLIKGRHPGKDDDLGVAVPTTLMPTGALHSRAQMIRFSEPDENLCVAPNFACGLNPVIPPEYVLDGPSPAASPATGTWSFVDKSGPANTYGYYVAVYRQDGFGFFEVYDTFSNPKSVTNFADFQNRVHSNNDGKSFSQTDVNTYKTIDGTVIQFNADAKIVTVNGIAPYDPARTNGTIINNNGQGVVTITNPALGQTLTLDASVPANHPQITVPGPVAFPDTCVGTTKSATLNVCNGGNGTDDLVVYNILSQNTQFQVTEPSSGYPTTIGSNFCFPFQAEFSPSMTGAISSTVKISSSDPSVPFLSLNVGGNGAQQGIATIISNSGNFGNVCVGSFTDLDLTINNTGGCDLIVSNIASSSLNFTVAGTLSFPLTIHAGDSLAVPIRFHPSIFGASTGNITVSSNDPKTPSAVVAVSGAAPPPAINATIANGGSFGNVCAGTQADLTLQVMNQGQCNLTITSINAMGLPSFVLPSVTTFPLVVGANGSVNLPIRFQPPPFGSPGYMTCSDTTPQAANIVIHSNDPNYLDPLGFVRPVNAIEGCPNLVLSPKDLTGPFAFPATVSDPVGNLGCYTDRQTFITNSGICPLNIASLTAGPSNAFSVINPTVPLSVAPGASPVPITVRFKPINLTGQLSDAPDQQTGALTIVSNDPTPSDNSAALCGEPAYHSGIRVLVVNAAGQPVNPLKSLSLSSKGLHPNVSQSLSPAVPATAPNICGNAITYTLDNETLPPAGTTGNNPLASYSLSAKQGSTQANLSFSLGQCEMKEVVMQIK